MTIARALPLLAGALVWLCACSQPQDAAPSSVASDARSAPASRDAMPGPVPRAETANPQRGEAASAAMPAESGLSIRRGMATLTPQGATFRPCERNVEWLLADQGETPLAELLELPGQEDAARASASDTAGVPLAFYLEARGEVSEDTYSFLLEQLLYADVAGETRGCEQPLPDYIVAAHGNEPFWSVEVGEARMSWRQPQVPQQIELGPAQSLYVEGTARYRASAAGHELELLLSAQPCRDSMSGEFFAYTARAVLDSRSFSGCARVAQ